MKTPKVKPWKGKMWLGRYAFDDKGKVGHRSAVACCLYAHSSVNTTPVFVTITPLPSRRTRRKAKR